MKYFVITSTIRDGEYEYLQQTAVATLSELNAIEQVENDNKEWIQNDYREQEINNCKQITEQEYNVISKYIY